MNPFDAAIAFGLAATLIIVVSLLIYSIPIVANAYRERKQLDEALTTADFRAAVRDWYDH